MFFPGPSFDLEVVAITMIQVIAGGTIYARA
jgi:hypothetical protein